ncbi:MAG: hypothetical protein ACTHKG_07730 [Nocardioides sp.]
MTTTAPAVRDRDSLLFPAAATVVASFAAIAFGTFADGTPGAEHHPGEMLIPAAITLVATGVVFGLVLPRALRQPSAPGIALALGLLGAATVAFVFWSGLVLPIAVGGLIAGRHTKGTAGTVAVALSALTCIAYVAVYVLDWMATNNLG